MSEPVAKCYELREVWEFGCPNPQCPLLAERARPVPCPYKVTPLLFLVGKPLPDDDATIVSPVGTGGEGIFASRGKKRERAKEERGRS